MYHENLARLKNVELDRELVQSIRTRTPMHDRPGPQRKGLRRLGHWVAVTAERLSDRQNPLPDGAELARLTIRPADAADGREIARLSELSERRVPSGYVLVAEKDEAVIAAMPLGGGHTVTDPRRSSSDVIELLELRSRQLSAGDQQLADAA